MSKKKPLFLVLSPFAALGARELVTAILLVGFAIGSYAQDDNDFGLCLSAGAEKKITKWMSFGLDAEFCSQNNFKDVERYNIGGTFEFKLVNTKKFDLKASAGWEYLWQNILTETEYTAKLKKKITDQHWRNRHRTTVALTGIYSPNKRWRISLKESVQYNHFCKSYSMVSKYTRYQDGEGGYYYEDKPDDDPECDTIANKDRFILRSRIAVQYDIKHSIFSPYAMVDYGCGLNYSTNKWKFTVGTNIDITKSSALDVFYRFQTEDDDDEPNGHLIGVGYKYKF